MLPITNFRYAFDIRALVLGTGTDNTGYWQHSLPVHKSTLITTNVICENWCQFVDKIPPPSLHLHTEEEAGRYAEAIATEGRNSPSIAKGLP